MGCWLRRSWCRQCRQHVTAEAGRPTLLSMADDDEDVLLWRTPTSSLQLAHRLTLIISAENCTALVYSRRLRLHEPDAKNLQSHNHFIFISSAAWAIYRSWSICLSVCLSICVHVNQGGTCCNRMQDTETCNLACTCSQYRPNNEHTKTRSVYLLCGSQLLAEKKCVNRHLKPAEPYSSWDAC